VRVERLRLAARSLREGRLASRARTTREQLWAGSVAPPPGGSAEPVEGFGLRIDAAERFVEATLRDLVAWLDGAPRDDDFRMLALADRAEGAALVCVEPRLARRMEDQLRAAVIVAAAEALAAVLRIRPRTTDNTWTGNAGTAHLVLATARWLQRFIQNQLAMMHRRVGGSPSVVDEEFGGVIGGLEGDEQEVARFMDVDASALRLLEVVRSLRGRHVEALAAYADALGSMEDAASAVARYQVAEAAVMLVLGGVALAERSVAGRSAMGAAEPFWPAPPAIEGNRSGGSAPSGRGSLKLAEGTTRLHPDEIATGERLTRQLGRDLSESPHLGAEFVDDLGRTYDACGRPAAAKFWNEPKFLKSIDSHLLKSNDFTAVDLTGFTNAQKVTVRAYIDGLPAASQARIIRIGF
jgi:hypothetical protein